MIPPELRGGEHMRLMSATLGGYDPLVVHAGRRRGVDRVASTQVGSAQFPGQPKVEETTYTSEYGAKLPAHVYHVENGQSRYSMTVVDYHALERMLTAKSEACPPGAETCSGTLATSGGRAMED